jgi:hypothetical protein
MRGGKGEGASLATTVTGSALARKAFRRRSGSRTQIAARLGIFVPVRSYFVSNSYYWHRSGQQGWRRLRRALKASVFFWSETWA